MAKDGHITITDRTGFATKIDAIKRAAADLRSLGSELAPIVAKAREEAGSFTQDGHPAPIFKEVLDALQKWVDALSGGVEVVASGSENAAKTALDKFTAITELDDSSSEKIKNT